MRLQGKGGKVHEVFSVRVEAGDLEDVEDVVDVEFGEAVGEDGAGEVGVAVVVEGGAGEELVDWCLCGILALVSCGGRIGRLLEFRSTRDRLLATTCSFRLVRFAPGIKTYSKDRI